MELDDLSVPPSDPLAHGLWLELRRLQERLALAQADDDGSLAETAHMLALKRGCRR